MDENTKHKEYLYAQQDMILLGKKIKEYRKYLGLSQDELGEAIGENQSWVSRLEKGLVPLTRKRIQKLSDALKQPLSFFITEIAEATKDNDSKELFHNVYKNLGSAPFLGTASAGVPIDRYPEANTKLNDVLSLPSEIYTIKIEGDSMLAPNGSGIKDGDIAIIKAFPSNWDSLINQIVVVKLDNDEYLVKRLVKHNGKLYLRSDNPIYPLIPLTENSILEGQLLYIIRDKKYL